VNDLCAEQKDGDDGHEDDVDNDVFLGLQNQGGVGSPAASKVVEV
jgi:hypothetical protein